MATHHRDDDPQRKGKKPTQLDPDAVRGPDSPPPLPGRGRDADEPVEVEPDDDDVLDAQPASDISDSATMSGTRLGGRRDSDVVEAMPTSDIVEITPASDIVEAEAADDEEVLSADVLEPSSAARREAESPPALEAQPVSDVVKPDPFGDRIQGGALSGDDIFTGPGSGAKPESDIHHTGKRLPKHTDLEKTEAFDGTAAPPTSDLDRTVAFEPADEDEVFAEAEPAEAEAAENDLGDESSAVDLGKSPSKGSSSLMGVDPVAEALESGVDLAAASGGKKGSGVELGDFAQGDSGSARRKTKHDDKTELDAAAIEEEAAADLLNEAEPPAADVDEAAAAALLAGGDMGTRADDEAPPADEEEERPKKKKKPKREPALVGAGAGPAPRPARSGKGGWLGGTLLGILLTAGAGAAVWYFAPDLLPESPNAPKKTASAPAPPPPPPLSLAQRARGDIDEQKYDAALDALKDLSDADKTPANLTARAEARWLKYQQQQAAKKAPLNAADEEVKLVLADLSEAKNTLLANQVVKSLQFDELSARAAAAQDKEKAMADLEGKLAKAAASQQQAETLVSGIHKALVAAKQIDADDKLDAATVQKLVKESAASKSALDTVNKLLAEAQIKDGGDKGVSQLLSAKKDAEARLEAVNKLLAGANIKGDGAKGLQELAAERDRLQKDRDELDQAIKSAYKELAQAKLVPAEGDPRKGLAAAAKSARQRAESPLAAPLVQLGNTLGGIGQAAGTAVRGAFETAALAAEVNYYRLREPLIERPEQKLDAWIALQQNRRAAGGEQAVRDAAWVLTPAAKAPAETKAKAHYVTGLVQRNQQKFAEARKSLEAAVAALGAVKSPGPWADQAKQALLELTDPAAYYVPRIEEVQTTGGVKQALDEIGAALQALPDDPRLLAQRALVKLDSVRGRGKTMPAEAQKSIRADAAAALKNPKTAAEGAYVVGMLEEELGNYDAAEKQYRAALKSHQGSAADAARYRISLARVLLREPSPVSAPPQPKAQPQPKAPPQPKEEKKAAPKTEEAKTGETSRYYPLAGIAAAWALGQAAPDDDSPAASARIQESIKLAEELIKSDNPKVRGQGHMLLGQALTKQGKRTEGVREYVKGIELLSPGLAAKDLARMLEEHPAFQQPDAAARPNAYLAELHFGRGMHLYWSRQYPEAEQQFKQAVEYFDQDARYQYFLGLAQHAQRTKVKRDAAYHSFEQGARLEAAHRPATAEINAGLERVQGGARELINHFRAKAIEVRN